MKRQAVDLLRAEHEVGVTRLRAGWHLHRYLAEFDFRHNTPKSLSINDAQRADNLVSGIVGKRLMHKTVD